MPTALAIHERQVVEHGGLSGLRDVGAIEAALARPRNIALYVEADAAILAAALMHGLLRNHGFADGNKRTAWVVGRLFLADNGYRLRFTTQEAIELVEASAAGQLAEPALADWLRVRIDPLRRPGAR